MNKKLFTYKKSGVNITNADKFVNFISTISAKKRGNKKFKHIGGFGSISDIPGNIINTSISNTTTESLLSHLQTIGSKIQRLENKEEALMDQTTAQEAVRSSIEDADFAEEQMELIKAQIMQQTATAALSQANTAPNIVLSLFEA